MKFFIEIIAVDFDADSNIILELSREVPQKWENIFKSYGKAENSERYPLIEKLGFNTANQFLGKFNCNNFSFFGKIAHYPLNRSIASEKDRRAIIRLIKEAFDAFAESTNYYYNKELNP